MQMIRDPHTKQSLYEYEKTEDVFKNYNDDLYSQPPAKEEYKMKNFLIH